MTSSRRCGKITLPIHIHSHDSSGACRDELPEGLEAGANIIDTALSSLASGTSQPPTESMVAALKDTPYDTGLDLGLLSDIADRFRDTRKKYKRYESEYTAINPKTLVVQIPGGMISNLANQLKEQNALDKMNEVFEEIPKVRKDMGYPPLVTPTSQVVGTQAVLNVLAGQRYTKVTQEVKNYLLGYYGRAPGKIDERVRKDVIGNERPIDVRPADLLPAELEKARRRSSRNSVLSAVKRTWLLTRCIPR